ncbi:NUDIX domain-containing protein [Bacillus luteolus]|uniref:NUDIX domain-containing protein n=1 Tax=Litchfieldia luteola TaxID=682179 RepID=A0ABR9QKN1_9BACI|nr:NUDIX domain-containing protein [Cytobacillus luteolus]MBE4909058.1 NUDIX domain-containing protein [Cytobacillus luteolus]MBP1941914.1 8-oxo-dGTP pyrophosphatase MutT (NUDIX family) [Cytobacillus luteolus]
MTKTIYVNWDEHYIKLTWYPTTELPPHEKVTSVHGYCFYKDKILLVHINGRGFNTPGGHIEANETPEDALHREVYEEGYVKGTHRYIGMIEVSHEENPHFDPRGKYPLIGYQLFYRMDITECLPFKRENEATSRIWVEPEELPYVIDDHELSTLILKEAMK